MNKLRILGGVVAVLGVAGLVVTPVGASSFNAGVLTLEETAANPAGYEWGLDGANGAAFVVHLENNGDLEIKNATKENIQKNLDALQKYVTDVKADPARAHEWSDFQDAMKNLQKLTLKTDNGDLKVDAELLAKFEQIVIGNGLSRRVDYSNFKLEVRFNLGTGVLDLSDLSENQLEGFLDKMDVRDVAAGKILVGGDRQVALVRNFSGTVPVEVRAAANQGTPERAGNGLKAPNTGANAVANTGALASLVAAVALSSLAGVVVVAKNRK